MPSRGDHEKRNVGKESRNCGGGGVECGECGSGGRGDKPRSTGEWARRHSCGRRTVLLQCEGAERGREKEAYTVDREIAGEATRSGRDREGVRIPVRAGTCFASGSRRVGCSRK